VWQTWELCVSVWVTECSINIYTIISHNAVATIAIFQDTPRRGTYQLLRLPPPLFRHSLFGAQNCASRKVDVVLKQFM